MNIFSLSFFLSSYDELSFYDNMYMNFKSHVLYFSNVCQICVKHILGGNDEYISC
jgi:hypothetical protein